jgi:type II secretory pathway pseudopilin PulG
MRAGSSRRAGRGFTYLGVLFLVVLLGLGLAGAGQTWSLASRHARERELLWTGKQYVQAIKAYYLQSPGARVYPQTLEDLLEDRRFPEPRPHLRKLYPDPITREPFETVRGADGRIVAVRSRSDETPLKQDNFPVRWSDFKGMTRYSDWVFSAEQARPQPVAGTQAPAATGAMPARK